MNASERVSFRCLLMELTVLSDAKRIIDLTADANSGMCSPYRLPHLTHNISAGVDDATSVIDLTGTDEEESSTNLTCLKAAT